MRMRALAHETGLPKMRHQVAQQLARLLPTIGPDLYTSAAVRRQVMSAIERIEVQGGEVVSVTLAGG